MLRICCNNSFVSGIFNLRINKAKCYHSQLKKLLYHDHSGLQCRSVFTESKTRSLHPQHRKDKVPEDLALIYENRLKRVIGPARILTTTAGLCSAAMSFGSIINSTETLASWDVLTLTGMGVFSLFMTFFFNVLFRYYLLRIYFNKDSNTFIGIYYSFLGNIKQIKYSLADLQAVKHPMTKSVHIKCNVCLEGRSFHLRGGDFVLPKYYNMHLGSS